MEQSYPSQDLQVKSNNLMMKSQQIAPQSHRLVSIGAQGYRMAIFMTHSAKRDKLEVSSH